MIPMKLIDEDLPEMSATLYFGCAWEKWNREEKEERERERHTGDVGLWDAIQNNSYRGILAM